MKQLSSLATELFFHIGDLEKTNQVLNEMLNEVTDNGVALKHLFAARVTLGTATQQLAWARDAIIKQITEPMDLGGT